jgi:hypothetical protein
MKIKSYAVVSYELSPEEIIKEINDFGGRCFTWAKDESDATNLKIEKEKALGKKFKVVVYLQEIDTI